MTVAITTDFMHFKHVFPQGIYKYVAQLYQHMPACIFHMMHT